MKANYEILNSKLVKELIEKLVEQYGAVPPNFKEHGFIRGKDNIYLITKDLAKANLEGMRINNLGLYIAEYRLEKNQIRLSIEGSQLIGPSATKNVCEVDKEQRAEWLKGHDLELEGEFSGHVIIKSGEDYFGTGKYKEGKILNHVPKSRRLQEVH
jgi:NOL1/NOP2/fmu family ribosome biogenesis protein